MPQKLKMFSMSKSKFLRLALIALALLTDAVTHPLRRRHALMVEDGAFSHKLDYIVTAIMLNRWILPIGGASLVEGLRSTGLPRLIFFTFMFFSSSFFCTFVYGSIIA